MELVLGCAVAEVDMKKCCVRFETPAGSRTVSADHVLFATDPQTAARLTGDSALIDHTGRQRVLGTSGKLNLMFRKPVRWKDDVGAPQSATAFRYVFAAETLADFETSAQSVVDGKDFVPGYFQVYCEGASMRHMGLVEPFDRLAIFFKHLGLGQTGEQLKHVEASVKDLILGYVANPGDCAWSRLLTPRDLQQIFGFPGGNIDHTMLADGQAYDRRTYSRDPNRRFYQFGEFENASICGSSTYPCGSVAGTPAYMCVQELLRSYR